MQRIRFVIVPGFVAILIFFSIEIFNNISSTPPPAELETGVNYDGYSEGINTILFNAQGQIDYTLQARRQVSYQDSVTELEQPFIQLYKDGDAHWNIVAKSGRISAPVDSSNEIEQIDLIGEVEVFQMDSFGNRTVLSTEFLSVDPVEETLNTDLSVSMLSEGFEQFAIGMQVNLDNEEYIFHREIRGRYAAQEN